MKRLIALSLALAAAFAASAADAKNILTEVPKHCYTFDTWTTNVTSGFGDYIKNSTGATALTFTKTRSGKIRISPRGGALWNDSTTSTKGEGPYGGGLALGSGDWTYYCRVKPISIKDGVLFCVGGHAGTATALSLLQNEDKGVSLVTTKGKALVTGSRTDIAVTEAVWKYHDYVIVFDATEKIAYLYVDGVLGGQLAHPNYSASNTDWQWSSISGGLGTTGYEFGADCDFEEFRFYQRKLTTDELAYLRDYMVKPVGYEFTDRAFTLPANQTLYLDATGKTLKTGDVVFTAVGGITLEGAVEIDGGTVELSPDKTQLIFKGEPGVIVTAHWTGLAGDGDIAKPGNWVCTNATGQAVAGALPTEDTMVYFTGDAINAQITNAVNWKAVSFGGALGADCDWRGLVAVPVAAGSSLDVNGRGLTLAQVFTGTITDTTSDTPGILTLTVAEGTTLENKVLAMTGNLKLVKNGAGTLVMAKNAEISQAEVAGGTFKLKGSRGLLGAGMVTVCSGATLDENGCYDTAYGLVLQDGATLVNSGAGRGYSKVQFGGGIALAENATAYVDNTNEMSFTAKSYAAYPINLNGGTLVKRGSAVLDFTNTQITNGTVQVEAGNIYLNAGDKGFLASADTVFEASGDGAFYTAYAATLPTLIGDGTLSGAAMLTVTHTLGGKISVDGPVTLANGATLDLRGNTEAYAVPEGLTFAAGTIVLDVSERTLAKGDQIVAWTAIPAGVTFQWDETTAQRSVGMVITETGIYYGLNPASKEVDKGYWTGAAGDGDPLNPQNWACTNLAGHVVEGGVPTNTTASVFIREPLSMNLDWTALGAVKFGEGMIDLNGWRLAVASIAETPAEIETLITNAVEGAGDIFIATGTTKLFTNLVFRAGTAVTVGGGATLDENGVIDMPLGVRLENGATLTNTGTARGYSSAQFMGGLQVADGATAYIDTPNQFAFTGKGYATMPIDLGTGTLVKRGKGKVSFQNAAIVGTGTIRLEEGEINLGNKGLSIADDITVEIRDNAGTDTYLWIEVTCAIPRLAGDGRIAASKASLTVTKYFSGRLKLGQKGGGNQFKDGTLTFGDTMTLDLAGVNGTWTQHKKMVYASNATVFADLADRTVSEGDKIIDWSAMPSVTSRILGRGRSPSAPLYFVRRADGLYAARTNMIFVR